MFSEFYNDKRSPYFSNAKAVISVTDIATVTTDDSSSMRRRGLQSKGESNNLRILQSVPMMNVTYSQDLYYYIRYYPTLNLTDEEIGVYPLSKLVNREKYVMHLKTITEYADVTKVTEITISNQLMVSEITASDTDELSSESTHKSLFLIGVSVALVCIFAFGGFVYARRKKARQMLIKKDEDIARAREIIRMMHEDIDAESMPGTEHPSENDDDIEVESIHSGAGTVLTLAATVISAAGTEGPSKPFDVDQVVQNVDQALQDGRSQSAIKQSYKLQDRSQTCPAVFRGYEAYVYELSDNTPSDDTEVSNTPSDDVSGLTYFGVEVGTSDYERSLCAVPSKYDDQNASTELVSTNEETVNTMVEKHVVEEIFDVDEFVEELNANKLAASDAAMKNTTSVDTNDISEDSLSIQNTTKSSQPSLPQSINSTIQDEWMAPNLTSTRYLSPLTPTIVRMPLSAPATMLDDDEATIQHHGYQIPPSKPQRSGSPLQIPLPSGSTTTNTASLSASLDVLDYQIDSLDSPLSCATEEPTIDSNIDLTGVEVVAS
jgi:hypothetical protein